MGCRGCRSFVLFFPPQNKMEKKGKIKKSEQQIMNQRWLCMKYRECYSKKKNKKERKKRWQKSRKRVHCLLAMLGEKTMNFFLPTC